MKLIKRYLLGIATYLLIFNPIPIFLGGVGSAKLLYVFLPFLFMKKSLRNLKYLRPMFFSILVYGLYQAGWALNGGVSQLYSYLIMIIEGVFLAYLVVVLHIKFRYSLVNTLLGCGMFAALSAFLALLIPSVDLFIRTTLSISKLEDRIGLFRSFGIGSELTFCFSIVLAIIYTMGLYYNRYSKILLCSLPIIFVAIIINARVGVISLLLGIAFYLLQKKNRSITKYIGVVIAIVLLFLVFSQVSWERINYETFDHAMVFFYEMSDFLFGTRNAETNTFGAIYNDYVIMPETFSEWIFGKGIWIFSLWGGGRSDSGWLNQLNYGGIVGILLLWNLILVYFRIIKLRDNRRFILIVSLVLLISNFKGSVIPVGTAYITVNMILMYIVMYEKKYSKTIEFDDVINRKDMANETTVY